VKRSFLRVLCALRGKVFLMFLGRVAISIGVALAFTLQPLWAQEQTPTQVYEQVNTDFERGNYGAAEAALRTALKSHPRDPHALGMLGVVLDAEKRYQEAEAYYAQALRLSPHSASLLNNLGNHYLAMGKVADAREEYLRVLALNPRHPNANLQLANISVDQGQGRSALHYLNALPAEIRRQPSVEILEARALHEEGKTAEAESLLAEVEQRGQNDPRVAFSVGMVEAGWKQYSLAEQALTRALDQAPANFDILYNLGLAAFHAGHFERARQALQIALRQRPQDVDTLYNLARVESGLNRNDQAVTLLVRAHHLAPERPDVLLLMGQVSEAMGYYGDAASAFEGYLRLKPHDALVRREYAFALARTPRIDEAVQDLRAYVQQHPHDARGLYELGVSETVRERDRALADLNRSIELDPGFTPARYARAVLFFQEGRYPQSVADLKFVLDREPQNYQTLDVLGQVDLQLNQPEEAVEAFSRAAQLAPKNRKILLHYSRALQRAHQEQKALAVLKQFQQLPPVEPKATSGLFDYLSLPVQEQKARYLEHLKRNMEMNPQDVSLKVRWGEAELAQGQSAAAIGVYNQILAQTADTKALRDCGRTLLEYRQYAEARKFLARALALRPDDAGARLDLAIAAFHTSGPAAALSELDGTPLEARRGDYYLLRAQMLDAMGKTQEAARDLTLGLRTSPTRADLYFEAALFLIKHNQYRELLDLLDQAIKKFPDSPQILLTQAIVYGLVHQFEQSQKMLAQIEARWPEWSQAYLINAIILVGQAKAEQARPLLETAIALGARDALAYYNLALADIESYPPDRAAAKKAIEKALALDPNDPYTQSLAGRIAYQEKDYQAALEHLTAAVRLWPDMVEAHQTLSATYRALGEKQKSIAELKEVLRIKQQIRSADQEPPSDVKNLLFSVPAPAPPAS
jgi:tetratricopeptide (TPR) repeat protein